MKVNDINNITSNTENSKTIPALFVGHGSPMNAIEENSFSKTWIEIGKILPKPAAVLCISAHWETRGTFVTAVDHPRTIHDFYGFPDSLFAVQYPAPGNPQLAREICEEIKVPIIKPDLNWGLDHGAWSVLKRFYPEANIPVVQLSLDYSLNPGEHYLLGKQLKKLRKKGVLIIGSGNIVHNLRRIDWNNPDSGHEWALEANEQVKQLILSGDYLKLTHYDLLGSSIQSAIPTPEHFLPLLYILSLTDENDSISFFNDRCVYGSLAMTSLMIKP